MRVLLTEDDIELADITASNLKKQGFAVDITYSGKEALRLLEENGEYDVIILDLILPDRDGIDLLEEIKSLKPNTPVLALTGRDTEGDRVNGIKIGFDDYVTKPFSHHELTARLRVLYRSRPPELEEKIKVGSVQIDPQAQMVFVDSVSIKLTLNEFRLLYHLVINKGQPVTKKELIESVWDMNSDGSGAKLLTTISRLRKKLGDDKKKIIKTTDNGYMIGSINV